MGERWESLGRFAFGNWSSHIHSTELPGDRANANTGLLGTTSSAYRGLALCASQTGIYLLLVPGEKKKKGVYTACR